MQGVIDIPHHEQLPPGRWRFFIGTPHAGDYWLCGDRWFLTAWCMSTEWLVARRVVE